MFVPTSKGTEADQIEVPVAVPELPVEVDHLTDATAVSSLAVPAILSAAAVVEMMLKVGDTIESEGGVPSADGVAGGCAGG
jgi:hypothetical protein